MIELKYFKPHEFDSPDQKNSHVNMDNEFLRMLDTAREYSTVPFKITSGYRTESHNNAIYAKLVLILGADTLYLPLLSKQDLQDLEYRTISSMSIQTRKNHKTLFGLTNTVGSTLNYGR
jgi:hypothetical protein